MKRIWTFSILALLAVIPVVAPHIDEDPRQAPSLRAAALELEATSTDAVSTTPSATLLTNDPQTAPHAISDALVSDIEAVPAGESIDVTTYWISSPRVASALAAAFGRGVQVRILIDGGRRSRSSAARSLDDLLNAVATDSSWLRRTDGAARGAGGIMHEKTYRFSRVGDVPWVTVTGSWNTAESADLGEYAAMLRLAGRQDVYELWSDIAEEQRAGRSAGGVAREYAGADWSAYFLPAADSRATDPVLRRLRSIPSRPGTVVRVAMFSMWGDRAGWLSRRLARMSRGGAAITVVAGPTVSRSARSTLRRGGVRVVAGCFRDGDFVHGKDMSASWVRDGVRREWTWIGSDNWTSRGMSSDQAVLGIRDSAVYDQFGAAFARASRRPGGVVGRACPFG